MRMIANPEREQRAKSPFSPVGLVHRVEGAAIAAAAATLFVLGGFGWWWLLALFLVFDLSFIGYAISNRVGAFGYNLVHNYAAPMILVAAHGILLAVGILLWPLAFIAGCWFFHVGADRAMGYGPRPSR
jgi:hypothetical protein